MTPPFVRQPFTVVDGGLSTALDDLGHRPEGLLWTAQLVIDRPDVVVQLGKLVGINIQIDAGLAKGKNVTIVEPAHVIDLGSAKTGVTITPRRLSQPPHRAKLRQHPYGRVGGAE